MSIINIALSLFIVNHDVLLKQRNMFDVLFIIKPIFNSGYLILTKCTAPLQQSVKVAQLGLALKVKA